MTKLSIVITAVVVAFIATFLIFGKNTSPNKTLHVAKIPDESNKDFVPENMKDPPTVVLKATGDVSLARTVNTQIRKYKDPVWPFLHTKEFLSDADITLINLENPLIKGCPPTDSGFVFCGDEETVQGLVASGIDVVNLANNHMGNYGISGIDQTKALLTKNNILHCGVDGPAFLQVSGITFAFLGYNDVGYAEQSLAWADEALIEEEITLAKKSADVVVVSFHWGQEYVYEPSDRQRFLAHLAIDSGADLIIGNHAHWEQAEEYYKGKYIKYAHGNFVFDQMWSEETRKGVVGVYTFKGTVLSSIEFIPVYISDYGQPRIVSQ